MPAIAAAYHPAKARRIDVDAPIVSSAVDDQCGRERHNHHEAHQNEDQPGESPTPGSPLLLASTTLANTSMTPTTAAIAANAGVDREFSQRIEPRMAAER